MYVGKKVKGSNNSKTFSIYLDNGNIVSASLDIINSDTKKYNNEYRRICDTKGYLNIEEYSERYYIEKDPGKMWELIFDNLKDSWEDSVKSLYLKLSDEGYIEFYNSVCDYYSPEKIKVNEVA